MRLLIIALTLSGLLLALTLLHALEMVSARVQHMLHLLRSVGITRQIFGLLLVLLWSCLWIILLLLIVTYAAAAPDTLGMGVVHRGSSFCFARACVLITTLGGLVVTSHQLQFWDETGVANHF